MTYKMRIILGLLSAQMTLGQAVPDGNTPSSQTTIQFTGIIRNLEGQPLTGDQTLTFSFYEAQESSSPIWAETHELSVDGQGRYAATLGSMSTNTSFIELFTSGKTGWIGVTPTDGVERTRIPIMSVPYAFKSVDAETLGGMRPEEFVSVHQLTALLGNGASRAGSSSIAVVGISVPADGQTNPVPSTPTPTVATSDGVRESAFARLNLANLYQGTQSFAAGVRLPAAVHQTNSDTFLSSAPLDFESSIIQPESGTYFREIFRWMAEPALSSSGTATATLSLLFGTGSEPPTPTGLSVNSDGTINFASGQVLPPAAVMEAISIGQNGFPGAGSNNNYTSPIVNTAPYQWTETLTTGAISPGPNVVTLTPCPPGVNGKDVWHYLYLSKTGTPEVVLITGGSCVGRQKSGTIEFNALYGHPAGYSIGSATDGVQEAIIDDTSQRLANGQLPPRNVLVDPGYHLLRARLSVRASNITISASGATITCAMSDTCIMLGDPSSGTFQKIVLNGLSVAAGIPNGTWPAVEDNANGSVITNLVTTTSSIANASFGSLIQVDNDQAAQITGLNTNLGAWSRCDTSFCSTAIVGPGVAGDSGVLWVQNSNLSLNCTANGINNQNGNTLHVSNTVVQAYPEFGIRSRSTYNDVPSVQLDSVYEEIGNCVNPLGTGMAGLIVEGGYANVSATVGPAGQLPTFVNNGTSQYNYSVVVHSSVMGTSPVYLAGYANTNGTGPIPVKWNQVGNTGIVTYDVLRTTGGGAMAPFGTGPFAVGTGIAATGCVNGVCTFMDDAESQLSTYTVSTNTGYWPALRLWPGAVILTTANDYQNNGGGSPTFYFTDLLNIGAGAGIVSSAGGFAPSVFAQACNPQGSMSSVWMQCLGGNAVSNDNPAITGTVLQLAGNGGNPGGLKGRLIFEMPPNSSVGATHVITLADSNPAKTMATPNNRPSWDPNDTYIGYDQGPDINVPMTQLSFGAPTSISNYIGNDGDNISWGERLTKTAKVFQVPVQAGNVTVDGVLTLNGPCSGCSPFSFSGTQVKDAFNEPNGSALGPNWTVTAGSWSISNDQATFVASGDIADGDSALVAYTGNSFASDQYATAQIIFAPSDTTAAGVGVRMSSSAESGYVCFAGLGLTAVLKYVAGVRSGFGIDGPALPSGDYLTAQVTGNTISCLDNGSPIPGLTITDLSSPLTSGNPGMFGEYGVSSFLKSFTAGNSSYTVNGLITSLAGIQTSATTFISLVACSSSTEGTYQAIVDSTTRIWGATITGGGSNHVSAYCDGSNWTVAAK